VVFVRPNEDGAVYEVGWFFFFFLPLYFVSRLESNVHKLIFFIKFQHEK